MLNLYLILSTSELLLHHLFWFILPQKWSNDAIPTGNYMLKVNNRNTRARIEICSKLTIKIPEQRQWRRSGVFIVNFEHTSHLVLVFL